MQKLAKYYTTKELKNFSHETLRDLYTILIDDDPNVTLDHEALCNVLHLKVPRYTVGNILEGDLVMDFYGQIYRVEESRHIRGDIEAPLIKPLIGGGPRVYLAPLFRIESFMFGTKVSEEQEDMIKHMGSYLNTIHFDSGSMETGCLYIHDNEYADYIIQKLNE